MFWNHCIISLRKLKQHVLFYTVSISVSAVGFTFLISSFEMFRSYGKISLIMIITAMIVFISNGINSITYKYSIKEVGIRKLLGADSLSIFKLVLTESVILSVLAVTFSLIVLDMAPFSDLFLYNTGYTIANFSDILFITGSIILVSVFTGLFPTYRLMKLDIKSHLEKN